METVSARRGAGVVPMGSAPHGNHTGTSLQYPRDTPRSEAVLLWSGLNGRLEAI